MNYKEKELFKTLMSNPDVVISATIETGDYDTKFSYWVVENELQCETKAVIGRAYETNISLEKKVEDEMFMRICDQYEGN